jgi:hypothetical protein
MGMIQSRWRGPLAPSLANAIAVARPIPDVPPVITATFSPNLFIILLLMRFGGSHLIKRLMSASVAQGLLSKLSSLSRLCAMKTRILSALSLLAGGESAPRTLPKRATEHAFHHGYQGRQPLASQNSRRAASASRARWSTS